MAFAPGDRVHIPRLGTGTIVDVRNGGRCLVEIKGRTMIVGAGQMEPAETVKRKRVSGGPESPPDDSGRPYRGSGSDTLDLHGKTVVEALAALDEFLNDALLASHRQVRVIHGRSGTRIRDAVHRRLRELPPVKSFRTDPRNAGVTIVEL